MNDLTLTANAAVPQSYAEKAMASLMQLHNELMDEKERRVELYRKLQEREQAFAELKLYVQSLEERLGGNARAAQPQPRTQTSASVSGRVTERTHHTPPRPPNVAARAHEDGWKVW